MDKFKQLNALRNQKAQAKKQKAKSIGNFLSESRKKAAEQVKRVHIPFYFKGRSDSVPSKVPRPELQFSLVGKQGMYQSVATTRKQKAMFTQPKNTIPLMHMQFRIWAPSKAL